MSLSSLLFAGRSAGLTSFFSLSYLFAFLPVCLILYSLTPRKGKKYFLLAASWCFFWLISGKLLAYLILSTFSMHYFGLWLNRVQEQLQAELPAAEKEERKALKARYASRRRGIVCLAAALHIGVLLTLKYSGFFTGNLNALFALLGVSVRLEIPKYLMPIGISFFTLQAASYILDVYRGVIKADGNLLRLALFLGFFPQIVEGPICRYGQTAARLWDAEPIRYRNLTLGAQRILFGMMKKIVVADRLNPLVKAVFSGWADYEGGIIALAAVCYTIQLYMDFSGSMDAVLGTAQIFGVALPENFERPFFSRTIPEFWRRWHITLGTWFKDYVFYPITTAKAMKKLTSSARKKLGNHYGPLLAGSIALFCVWFCNGLWHGAAWNYIFFGMYHFVLILAGNIISPLAKWTNKKLHIDPERLGFRLVQTLRTAALVVVGELFFRAEGLAAGLGMFRAMVTRFSFRSLNDALLVKLGVDRLDLLVVAIALAVVFFISLLNERGVSVRESLAKKNAVLRWGLLYALILFIVIFGAYGFGYAPVDPLYAQF